MYAKASGTLGSTGGLFCFLIERITVYEDHLDFEFKSGLETEVQM
jgi:hypothetical protein